MKYIALFVVLFLFAIPALADDGQPVYNVAGTLTIAGVPSCSGSCSEVISFSFEMTYQYSTLDSAWFAEVLPTNNFTTASGPIAGSLKVGGPGNVQPVVNAPPNSKTDANYISMTDAAGDEFDLYLVANEFASNPPPPGIGGGYLYGCSSTTCNADLCPLGPRYCSGQTLGIYNIGTLSPVSVTVVPAPEPSVIPLLVIGLGILISVGRVPQNRFDAFWTGPTRQP